MKRLLFWLADRPFVALGLLAVVTVAFAFQVPRLRIDESAEGLMVEGDPARQFYEQVTRRFGSDNLTIVLVKTNDVFTAEALGVVRRVSEGLERIDGVTRVESLTTVRNIKARGDALDTEPLIGSTIPTASADLARIRADALSNRVFVGNVVASDGRATAITVYANPPPGDAGFNRRFADRVDALIREHSVPGVSIIQVGVPLTKATYSRFVEEHTRTAPPLGLAVLLIVLFLGFRMMQGVVIPLLTAVISIVWAVGLMALLDLPLTVLTGTVPSLLLAIGFTEDVHMISAYHERLRLGDGKVAAIQAMLEETGLAILVTTATTVLGFASLAFTDITMLVQFGYAAALGLIANLVVTVIGVPALLRLWRVPRRLRAAALAEGESSGLIGRFIERLAGFNMRHRAAILVTAGVVTAIAIVGWTTLRVDTDLIGYFPGDSAIRVRIEELHRSLPGPLAFYVVIDTDRADGIKDPALLRKIAELQHFLAGTGKVAKTVSIADYLRAMHREMNGGDPAYDVVPDSSDQVAQYLLVLEGRELGKFVDFDASGANVVVRHNLSSSADFSALQRQIEAFVAKTFGSDVVVRSTGEAVLFNNAADYMAINEVTSFAFTLVVIGLIHTLLFTSLAAGVVSLIPNLVPIVCTYGLMGFLGIPLNTGTAMVATIALGIAVDDTVHHMVTFSRRLREHHDQKIAMIETMRSQGRPIIYVSLALACGFLVSATSKLIPAVHFGLLAAVVMILAMVTELMLTPILMRWLRLVTLWDLVLLKMRPEIVRVAPLLNGLSRWEARKVILLGTLQQLDAGQLLIRTGEHDTDLYMLVSGRARVFAAAPGGVERTLAILEPGAVFGEVAAFTDSTRSASVVIEAPSEIFRLDFQALERIRRRFPYTGAKIFRNLARMLAVRLTQRTEDLLSEPMTKSRNDGPDR